VVPIKVPTAWSHVSSVVQECIVARGPVARQRPQNKWLYNSRCYVTAPPTDTRVTIPRQQMNCNIGAVFSTRSVPRCYKQDKWGVSWVNGRTRELKQGNEPNEVVRQREALTVSCKVTRCCLLLYTEDGDSKFLFMLENFWNASHKSTLFKENRSPKSLSVLTVIVDLWKYLKHLKSKKPSGWRIWCRRQTRIVCMTQIWKPEDKNPFWGQKIRRVKKGY
jgi:hypothetical protein